MHSIKTFYELPFLEFLNQFQENEHNEISIPCKFFELSMDNSLETLFILNSICNEIQINRLKYFPFLCCNNKKIIIKGEVNDMLECYVQLDYFKREMYIDLVYEMNSLIPTSGLVNLFVSDVPGHSDSILYIECDPILKKDLELIATKFSVKLMYDKGLIEFMYEMAARQWNSYSFLQNWSYEETKNKYLSSFYFPSNNDLMKQGYEFNKKEYKPKIFISYSWANKKNVEEIVDLLCNNGLNLWIDYRAIDYGEHILESIQNGIDECDLAICFISHAYQVSSMAKHELKTLWTNLITNGKKWCIVKIDDVNPNDIFPGLMQYKYFDLMQEDKELLLLSIKNTLDKIKKNNFSK